MVHAAGESANNVPPGTFAVVLAVDNEKQLLDLESRLIAYSISHHSIREPDHPFNGALTAIGFPPCHRKFLSKFLGKFKLFKGETS